MAMTLLDRVLSRAVFGRKAIELPIVPRFMRTALPEITFARVVDDGYKKNAAVFACINAHALAYQQLRPVVQNRAGEPLDGHPLQALLDRPNEFMSWPELALYISTYKAIGGNCYLHKVRDRGGRIVELYPYHDAQMTPKTGDRRWIEVYEYDIGDGEKIRLDPRDIVHLKWPAVDPRRPWVALAPLLALAAEVDTDTEATRYLYALLHNDATPRTILHVKRELSPTAFQRLRDQWRERHGGENRGGVAIVEGEADVSRLGLNLQELAFDALREVPEARICAVFRVPPEYLGLNVGLKQSTFNNKQEARRGFLEDTILQLCALDAGELTSDLAAEFGGDVVVTHSTDDVAGLGENLNEIYARALNAFDKDTITRNEARALLGLAPIEDLAPPPAVAYEPGFGWLFKSGGLLGPEPEPEPEPPILEGEIVEAAPMLEDQEAKAHKARRRPLAVIEERMQRDVRRYLARQYVAAADAIAQTGAPS